MAFGCIHGGECTGCMDCQEENDGYGVYCPECGEYWHPNDETDDSDLCPICREKEDAE